MATKRARSWRWGFLLWSAAVLPAGAQECVWGGFDASRLNVSSAVLSTGSDYEQMRATIQGAGATIAAPTATLTAGYLAGVDVFWTSLLKNNSNGLSSPEQTALRDWVASGGTLIVTGDIYGLNFYEDFTSTYGVTGWTVVRRIGSSSPVAAHAITQGVGAYDFNSNSTFRYRTDALLLGNDDAGNPLMVVMEPSTGFEAGGRIFVCGDLSLFHDGVITNADNLTLAANLVDWACAAMCPTPADATTYGSGWSGTAGIPGIGVSSGSPVLGQGLTIGVGNSRGSDTVGVLLVGINPASFVTQSGATIEVAPFLSLPMRVSAGGRNLAFPIPEDPRFCGRELYLQVLEVDPGAVGGYSLTRGLKLTLGGM